MKKFNHPVDEFFREALDNHQMTPSEAAKQAFLKDVMKTPPPDKGSKKGLILLSAFLVLISAGIFLWAISTDKFTEASDTAANPGAAMSVTSAEQNVLIKNSNTVDIQKTKSHLHPGAVGKQTISEPPVTKSSSKSSDKHIQNTQKPDNQTGRTGGQTHQFQAKNESTVPLPSSASNQISVDSQPDPVEGTSLAGTSVVVSSVTGTSPVMSEPKKSSDSILNYKKPDSVATPLSDNKMNSSQRTGNSHWIPDIGVYYTPEWMFNTLEGTKFVNNFGIEGTFHFGKFSVRTGAGISIGKGVNELVVEYNEHLGSYNNLDSIDFKWDDPTHNYIPTMYLSQKDVWDSLMKLDYARVVKRYTYLQIPMIMGYDFWQTDKISIGVRMGPVMSILLESKQLSSEYDPGKNRIVSVNDIAPEQVSLNWQVMGGLNAAFHLTKEVLVEIEPNARYYFNSVYEKPANNTKPWSVGLRAAFVVRF